MARTQPARPPSTSRSIEALEREIQAGPVEGGRPPAQRSRPRAPVRRLAHHGGPRGPGPAARRARRAPRRLGHLRARPAERARPALSFGLLIPDLGETEIFEPICQGMMASPLAREHALVWGSVTARRERRPRRARLAALPAVHRPEGVGRVLRAARADAGQGRGQPPHRAGARRRRASRSSCSTARWSRIRGAATTTWSASTTGAPAT